MKPEELFQILSVAEKLKCSTRHSYTSSGRQESVAEHSWRLALMALLIRDEFPKTDMSRVTDMCLIHDLGEAFTGDIPAFEKKKEDGETEEKLFRRWVDTFPSPTRAYWIELLDEMECPVTEEAKIYKALDKMEALIQHNEADLSTWIPLEYDLQFTYGKEQAAFSPYMKKIRDAIDVWTREKMNDAENKKSGEV